MDSQNSLSPHAFCHRVCQHLRPPFLDPQGFHILLQQIVRVRIRFYMQIMPDQDPHLLVGIGLQPFGQLYNFFAVKSSFIPTAACSALFSATIRPGFSRNSSVSASPAG